MESEGERKLLSRLAQSKLSAVQAPPFRKNVVCQPQERPAHADGDQDRGNTSAADGSQRLAAVQIDVRPYQRDKTCSRGEAQGNADTNDQLGQPFPHRDWCGPASPRFILRGNR